MEIIDRLPQRHQICAISLANIRISQSHFSAKSQHTINPRIITIFQTTIRAHVSLQTSRIVPQPAIWTRAGIHEPNWPQVDSHVLEWTSLNTSTPEAWLEVDGGIDIWIWGRNDESWVARNVFAISAHAVGVAVEDG